MTNTAGQRLALIDRYGKHRRPVLRSHCLIWPTPQATRDGLRAYNWWMVAFSVVFLGLTTGGCPTGNNFVPSCLQKCYTKTLIFLFAPRMYTKTKTKGTTKPKPKPKLKPNFGFGFGFGVGVQIHSDEPLLLRGGVG